MNFSNKKTFNDDDVLQKYENQKGKIRWIKKHSNENLNSNKFQKANKLSKRILTKKKKNLPEYSDKCADFCFSNWDTLFGKKEKFLFLFVSLRMNG